ncbi:MFS transporter [Streptomyces sp. WAC06614]|uniref:MFS transporter n=1 Tax=Streptomyces sp. WAC06614 TaxID=2487416 RepID=UPI000F788B8E|nr:MFS transporter [Streptomyces sp. WAC06614]RSS82883.1 MFS transporter [Streptomyces sp. WAC06614]
MPRDTYAAVFRVTEFRAVFAAHLLSVLGLVVAELALTVLVYRLTGSPLMSALTFALGFLPYLLGGTLLAPLADRRPARRVLVVCDLVCAVCAAAMVLPGTPVAVLLALRCVLALIGPLFQGTRNASLADVLGPGERYVLGRSLLRMVSQSAQLTGFGLGGVLLALVSPRSALAVTAAGFAGSALLLRYGTRRRPARAAGDRSSLPAGLRAVLGDRRTRSLMLLFWLPSLFLVVPEALMAPYVDGLGAGTTALGLLMCALPVGTVAGELWAGSALSARARSRLVGPLAVAGFLPLLGYALRPGLALLAGLLLLAGLAHAYTLGLDQWFVEVVPEELRGRAMTLLSTGLMTLQGVGMALAGLAAEFLPLHQVVAGAAVLGASCVLVLLADLRAADAAAAPRGPRTETGLSAK